VDKIKPQIPKGFRDFLPSQKVIRQQIIDTIRNIFELFGFEPLETPALEYASILEGKYGEEGEKLIYKFEDRGGRKVALRYDLTIPLSRVIAMHPTLPKPFKCYQIAPVWRADKPQRGRFREFWQCDADIVGSESMLADAEVIATIYHILKALHFKQFKTRINNRKLLNGIAQALGIEEDSIPSLLRIIDKLEQKGLEVIKEEMHEKGFREDIINVILELIQLTNGKNIDLFTLSNRFSDSTLVLEGIKELEELFSHLTSLGIDSDFYCFDFSLARGLDYYTGPIFETTVDEPKIGSITGGGRYDTLIGMFSDTDFPATGSSFGLERIITVMEELNITPSLSTITEVFITVFSPEMQKDSLRIASELRSAGIKTEVYFKHDNLKKQLTYASNKGIPFVIIIGPDEKKNNSVILRNMFEGSQKAVACDELVYTLKKESNGIWDMKE
jgi:histidyl-tRNA synthetase